MGMQQFNFPTTIFLGTDALAALKMSVRELIEDPNLDVDEDDRVTAEDARLILRDAVAAIGTCEPG